CWPHSQGRKARGPAGPTAHEGRAAPQHEDRQGARPCLPDRFAGPRRRGDRMTAPTMHRRSFLTLLGASAAAWPLAARGQQAGRVRRIGVLTGLAEEEYSALREGLAKLGWIEGRNLRIDLRFTLGDPDRIRAYAAELVSLAPDVIVTTSRP